MTLEEATEEIYVEIFRAEKKHGPFPADLIHGAAIVAEEAGELVQASISAIYAGRQSQRDRWCQRTRLEAIQTAAMAIRFLRSYCE